LEVEFAHVTNLLVSTCLEMADNGGVVDHLFDGSPLADVFC